MLQHTMNDKQIAINRHIDENAALKQELQKVKIETKRIDLKLKSYAAASYVLDHILPKPTGKDEDGENVYGYNNHGLGYHAVPPPMWSRYKKKEHEGVDKALNIQTAQVVVSNDEIESVNDESNLPENLDVMFEKNDSSDCDSMVCNDVIDKVLKSDDSANIVVKSGTILPKPDNMVKMYQMIGSDKIYSDKDFPIQNVNPALIAKTFSLIEDEDRKSVV